MKFPASILRLQWPNSHHLDKLCRWDLRYTITGVAGPPSPPSPSLLSGISLWKHEGCTSHNQHPYEVCSAIEFLAGTILHSHMMCRSERETIKRISSRTYCRNCSSVILSPPERHHHHALHSSSTTLHWTIIYRFINFSIRRIIYDCLSLFHHPSHYLLLCKKSAILYHVLLFQYNSNPPTQLLLFSPLSTATYLPSLLFLNPPPPPPASASSSFFSPFSSF